MRPSWSRNLSAHSRKKWPGYTDRLPQCGPRFDAQLAAIERRLQGVLRAIEDGAWSETLRHRLNELETSKAGLQQQRDDESKPTPAIRLHPNAANIYRAKVADLEASLNAPEIRVEASEALRALIERVVLTPDTDEPDGLRAELYGDLAEILRLGETGRALPGRRADSSLHNKKPPGTVFWGVNCRWLRGHATDDPTIPGASIARGYGQSPALLHRR